ncbi:MAG: phage terminase small subunit P27 family [Lachnospiraceae bacterium]|nr:phage terminase small subunit P27 family [Lachnospiraceae bacterium]
MARPRQPIDLIVAKGKKHLTKAEYEERKKTEISAPCDKIEAPDYLSKKEKEKFHEIAQELKEIGIMSNLDCDILARYIRAATEYEKVTKQLGKIKFTPDKKSMVSEEVQIAEQIEKYNYLQKIQARLERQCNADARELGLTISSRCKLVMPKKEETKPENKFLKHA